MPYRCQTSNRFSSAFQTTIKSPGVAIIMLCGSLIAHTGDLLRAARNVRVPVPGAVDGHALHQVAHAGVHRLPGQAHHRRRPPRAPRDNLLGVPDQAARLSRPGVCHMGCQEMRLSRPEHQTA